MDPFPAPTQSLIQELRILVVHNQDFSTFEKNHPDVISRMDVVHAAQDVGRALAARGHFVEIQAIDSDDLPALWTRLSTDPPDLVFNLCESLKGDDRNEIVLPAILDLLGVSYTGSAPLALGLSLRKEHTQALLCGMGILVPKSTICMVGDSPSSVFHAAEHKGLTYPLIIKPTRENASVGIDQHSVVWNEQALVAQVQKLHKWYQQPLLIEEYIQGKEFNVSILGNNPVVVLPLHEIDFSSMPKGHPPIVSYAAKWDTSSAEYAGSMPIPATGLSERDALQICNTARSVYRVLGLSDYARCDIRVNRDGQAYLIDVNPNCDLSREAGFAKAALHGGISYEELIEQIAISAMIRSHHATPEITTHFSDLLQPTDPSGTNLGWRKNQDVIVPQPGLHTDRDGLRL